MAKISTRKNPLFFHFCKIILSQSHIGVQSAPHRFRIRSASPDMESVSQRKNHPPIHTASHPFGHPQNSTHGQVQQIHDIGGTKPQNIHNHIGGQNHEPPDCKIVDQKTDSRSCQVEPAKTAAGRRIQKYGKHAPTKNAKQHVSQGNHTDPDSIPRRCPAGSVYGANQRQRNRVQPPCRACVLGYTEQHTADPEQIIQSTAQSAACQR